MKVLTTYKKKSIQRHGFESHTSLFRNMDNYYF